MDIDAFDEELDDTGLLGGEKLTPQRIEPFQRLAHLSLRNVPHGVPCRAPGAHDDLGRPQQTAQLIDDRGFDLARRHALDGTGCGVALQHVGRNIVAVELALATRVSGRHRRSGWPEDQALEQAGICARVRMARLRGLSRMAGTALYALVADDEPGAHVYAAATTRDQARIVFGEAERMVDASPALRARVTRTVNNLAVLPTSSWFRPLSADASKMDGLNVHFAGVDEVHEHPNPEIIQKLNTATGARRQPLLFEITTAGHDRHSVCRQHHEFSVKTLEGTIPTEASDSWFAYIATIDAGDDWTDPAVWIKANPSLGVTVKIEDLKRQIDEAREMPAQQNAIRRLRLNEWTEQVTRWLDMAVWDGGGLHAATDWRMVKEELDDLAEMLAARTCYGGLDLARVNDLSAFVLLFPPTGDEDLRALADKWIALCRFWVPEEDILRRARRDRVPYDVWRDQGFLVATPGNATDFAFIEREIVDLAARFDLREVAYDRTFAGEIVQNLQDEGVKLVEFGQGFLSLAAPTAELERLAVSPGAVAWRPPVACAMKSSCT